MAIDSCFFFCSCFRSKLQYADVELTDLWASVSLSRSNIVMNSLEKGRTMRQRQPRENVEVWERRVEQKVMLETAHA
jgi:hypothetical protein